VKVLTWAWERRRLYEQGGPRDGTGAALANDAGSVALSPQAELSTRARRSTGLAASGELPSYKVEGRRPFEQSEVARWLDDRRIAENGERP
jgi:hypothetical protein